MSAASPAPSQVRRNSAVPRPASPTQAVSTPAMRPAAAFAFTASDMDDDFRLNLTDIPRIQFGADSMHVEGLKPSLLSRLFDLFAPKR